jgi:hypothetical protein
MVDTTVIPGVQQMKPAGAVLGAAGAPGELAPHPTIGDTQTYEEALRERGRRRAQDEIAPEYTDLA